MVMVRVRVRNQEECNKSSNLLVLRSRADEIESSDRETKVVIKLYLSGG